MIVRRTPFRIYWERRSDSQRLYTDAKTLCIWEHSNTKYGPTKYKVIEPHYANGMEFESMDDMINFILL